MRIFFRHRSERDGQSHLPTNLCRAFSRLFPVKVLDDLGGNPLFLSCRPHESASRIERHASVDGGATLGLRVD